MYETADGKRSRATGGETETGGEDVKFEDYTEFDGRTYRNAWKKIITTLDRLIRDLIDIAGGLTRRTRIELEIASIRLRLRNLYSKVGEAVFRLAEGEDDPRPLENEDVRELFREVRRTLSELAKKNRRLEKLKRGERWTSGA